MYDRVWLYSCTAVRFHVEKHGRCPLPLPLAIIQTILDSRSSMSKIDPFPIIAKGHNNSNSNGINIKNNNGDDDDDDDVKT